MVHAANLHASIRRDLEDLSDFYAVRHNHLDAAAAENRAFASDALQCGGECGLGADGFQLEEFAIGAALFDEIADGGYLSFAEDEHLNAGFFHVAQKMRRE